MDRRRRIEVPKNSADPTTGKQLRACKDRASLMKNYSSETRVNAWQTSRLQDQSRVAAHESFVKKTCYLKYNSYTGATAESIRKSHLNLSSGPM